MLQYLKLFSASLKMSVKGIRSGAMGTYVSIKMLYIYILLRIQLLHLNINTFLKHSKLKDILLQFPFFF